MDELEEDHAQSGQEDRPPRVARETRTRLESPLSIGVIAGSALAICMLLRFAVVAKGNFANFILVGSYFATRSQLPPGIPVHPGTGYDGQFYYRLAVDPLNWSASAFGIHLDSYSRLGRIGYSAIVWLASAGRHPAIPVVMVIVNVVAFGVLAALCASLSRLAGRNPLFGLLIAGYWGFLWSASRDTTELVAVVFLVAAALALRRDHPVLAGALLAFSVLSRESGLVFVAAVFIARVVPRAVALFRAGPNGEPRITGGPGSTEVPRSTGEPGSTREPESTGEHGRWRFADEASWAIPVVCFAGWQIGVEAEVGHFPILSSGKSNTGAPFVGLFAGISHYVSALPARTALLWGAELAVILVIAVYAAFSLRNSSALLHERIAWVGYVILTLCIGKDIWLGDVGFRSLYELYVFSSILLLFSKERLRVPAVVVAATWIVVAIELILVI